MISLKRNIEDFDYRLMFEAAIGAYRSALGSLEQNTVKVEHDEIVAFREKLLQLQNGLNPRTLKPETLRDCAGELDAELGRYRFNIEALLKSTGNDLKEVVAVLADAADSLSQREQIHGSQLSRLSGSLEAISQIDNLPQLRGKLGQHVFEFRACMDQMARENESAVQTLQQELIGFQKKLEKVQIEASTDPLTGIANRRRASREVSARMREQRTFGVLLLDLNKFKQINDSHGHGAGDCVLQIVAQRLSGQVRKDDLVCRWGGDEFLIIRDGSDVELAERCKDVAQRIAGQVSIDVAGQNHEIMIGAGVGWAEYRLGETVEQLLARADTSLYEAKARRDAGLNNGISLVASSSSETGCASAMAAVTAPQPVYEIDPSTGLPSFEELKAELTRAGNDAAAWTVASFAIRNPEAVDAHYGYAAAERVLPFLKDEIRSSPLGVLLFGGPGTSLFALVKQVDSREALEKEMQRIASIGFEKLLPQKRRQSIRPIPAVTCLLPYDPARGASGWIQDLERFIAVNKADEKRPAPAISRA